MAARCLTPLVLAKAPKPYRSPEFPGPGFFVWRGTSPGVQSRVGAARFAQPTRGAPSGRQF